MRLILTLTAALMVSGCVMGLVKSEVARFNAIPPSEASRSVYVMPLEAQQGNVEFAVYSGYVAEKLREQGYTVLDTRQGADFIAFLDYGVGGTRQITETKAITGKTGGGTTYHSGTVSGTTNSTVSNVYGNTLYGKSRTTGTYSGTSYTPETYGVVGTKTNTYTQTDRYFHFMMYQAELNAAGQPVQVYKGEVKSSGRSQTFARVSKCLINALFKKFEKTGTQNVTVTGGCVD